MTENICECIYCKKKYNVKNLDKHKCIKKLANTNFIDMDIDKILDKIKNNDDVINDAKILFKNNKSKTK